MTELIDKGKITLELQALKSALASGGNPAYKTVGEIIIRIEKGAFDVS